MMSGVITFYSSQQVMKAEKIVKKNNYEELLIPGPREISPNCGVAICFDYNKAEEIKELFKKEKILYENIYYYPEAKKISKWF
jgi:hypothetical protein